MTLLAEPSYHYPVNTMTFAFLGLGAGVASATVSGAGFALAPRAGVNIMIGRSGILTPAFQVVYNTSGSIQTPQGTLLAVTTSYGMNLGYTVMW